MNEMRKWMRLCEETGNLTAHPKIMYHTSPENNRDSIAKYGLCQRFDQTSDEPNAIYLSTKNPGERDTWQVDVRGLSLEPDYTDYDRDEYGEWWVYYDGDIPPSRLRRITPD